MTPLDAAFAAMAAADQDDTARLRFYARLADGEMFLLLDREATGDTLTPRVFHLDEGPVVLAFDREERLTAFTGMPAPYAALPGRVIAAQLAGKGIGLGLNLGVAASSMLLPPDAVAWLAETLGHQPTEVEATPETFFPPAGLPQSLIEALDAKLSRAGGLATAALMAGVTYSDGRRGHMLAFLDAAPGAEAALARACAEALTFSGIEAGEIDVTFLTATEAVAVAMARVALRFDLPPPPAATPMTRKAPGTDPTKPPILR